MKYPLVYVLTAYIMGILSQHILDFSTSVFLIICIAAAYILKRIFSKRFSAVILLLLISFLAGNTAYYISYNDIFSDFNSYNNEYITVTGRMCEIPEYNPETGISKFIIAADMVEYKGETFKVKDKIQVSAQGEFAYGLTVKVSGLLKEFDERLNSAGYDSKMQHRIKRISYKIFAAESDEPNIKIIRKNKIPSSVSDAFNMIKSAAMNIIGDYFSGDNAAILRVILFGDYNALSSGLEHKLNISGAMRFLRSAYLSILILTSVTELIAVRLFIPKKYRIFITSLFIILFIIYNHSHPSFIRTGVFFIVFMLYRKKYGYLYLPDAISAGILIILLMNPLLIFSGGFVLSASSCIMLYMFRKHADRFLRPFIRNPYLRNMFSTWLICTFSLLPLYAYYYNSISLYTLIYSLIFPPLIYSALIIMPFVVLLLASVHTAPILYQIIIFILFIIRHTVDFVSYLPHCSITLSSPTLLIMITFFTGIYILWLKLEREDKTDTYMILCISFAVFTFTAAADYCMQYGGMQIHFINVGQGDSTFIEVKGMENILIDGGGSAVYSDYKVGEEIVVPYIEAKGGDRIDTVIVTHYHKDHCDGIIDVLHELDVNRIILPACREDNEYRIQLEDAAKAADCEIIYAKAGLNIDYPSGLKIKVLLPDEELLNSYELNDTSIVTKISYGEFDALFMGDMTEAGENKLLNLNKTDLLKAGHHGSATSTSDEFIKNVSPLITVVSVGENNSYGLPSEEVMSRIEKYSTLTLRTDNNGDITVYADKSGIKKVGLFRR